MPIVQRRSISNLTLLFLCLTSTVSADGPADDAFAKGNYLTARELYVQARENERSPEKHKEWLRISAQIVRCDTAIGDLERAGLDFFYLCSVDPQTAFYDCIPLPWNPPMIAPRAPTNLEKAAEDVLDPLKNRSPGPAAMLLASGILSVSPRNDVRNRGLMLLRELTQTEGPAAKLAGALLWKQQLPTLKTVNELAILENGLEKLPEPFRAGPYFLLGRAAANVGEQEKAVLYWMRLPILYPDNKPLADAALFETARMLEKLGRPDEAVKLRNSIQ